jgi:drug/metabolite transporter (DMT)-like permease
MLVLPGNGAGGARVLAMLLVVAAAVLWAGGSFISTSVRLPSDPLTSTAVQMMLGGTIAALAGVVTGEAGRIDVSTFSAASVWALVYLVTAGSLLAFTAYTWLLQNAPITKVSTYAYVNPVIAVFLGWLVMAEPITPLILAAASVIVVSVAFIVRKEAEPVPSPEEVEPVSRLGGGLGARAERLPAAAGVAAAVARWIRR